MSFILDALKKSESERQRKSSPQLSDVPIGTRRRVTPRWIWLVAALLLANAAVLTGLLLKRPTTAAPAAAPASSASVPAEQTTAPTHAAVPGPAAATPTVAGAGGPGPDVTEAPALAAADAPAAIPAIPAEQPAPRPAATEPERPARTETLLTFDDVRASGNVNLPDLHVDLHVYSDVPADRFVFINMKQYREDARLTEGPRLVEITPEGVILDYAGSSFLLPRD